MSRLARCSCVRPAVRPLNVRLCGSVLTAILLAGCSADEGEASRTAPPPSPSSWETGASSAPAGPGRSGPVAPSGSPRPAAAAQDIPAAVVLRTWDHARARAFAEGDPAALRRLYVAGSRAGWADVRVLRGYLRRGLRVEGMRMQVLTLEVVEESPRRLRLRVTDRLADGVVVGQGGSLRLPRDGASTRLVELVRASGGRWLVSSVREARRPTRTEGSSVRE